jgi:hypothetical protein
VRVLSYDGILQQAFDQWRMKYIPLDQQAKLLLSRYGAKNFRPDQLSADAVSALLNYAAEQKDDSLTTQVLAEGRLLEDEMVRERTMTVLVIGFFVFLALFSMSMIVLALQLG